MLSETELKSKLQELAKNDFHPAANEDVSNLIPSMLQFIGSTDSILRDNLIYSAFANWILKYKVVSTKQLLDLAQKAISGDHIFFKIGDMGTDTVFCRSFSMLLLPLILISHRSSSIFSKVEVLEIKESLLRYLHEEKDFRGFIENKGWAHAIAHCADALDDIAQCTELDEIDLREILEGISHIVCQYDTTYVYGEEERLSTALIAILKRQLVPENELKQWINGFVTAERKIKTYPEKITIRSNIKNFLQSLYFRIIWEFQNNSLLEHINHALYVISPYNHEKGDENL